MDDYEAFIENKSAVHEFGGLDDDGLPPEMFPHQRDLTSWALRKGRAAIFADTGLGKTIMELAWARRVSREGRVLILAPLAVAQQIEREGERFGIDARYAREDDGQRLITITNYEMLDRFDARKFVGVVLDESSILKSFTGKTRNLLIESFAATPYRLAATATPAPNDFTELGNHSEFLGVKTRTEMLAEYFVHDGGSTQNWRVKGHAVGAFWKWVATWGAVLNSPEDLGHDGSLYDLPPLNMHDVVVDLGDHDVRGTGLLFPDDARTLSEQRAVRKATIGLRAEKVAEIVGDTDSAIVWCELNAEADAVTDAIDGAVQVKGSDTVEHKTDAMLRFAAGEIRVLVSKAKICGHGMNFQVCNVEVFAGVSHSFEQTYQAIRRCWRFGQTKPVDIHMIRTVQERAIVENYRRKEADAARMGAEMATYVMESVRAEITGSTAREFNAYNPAVKMLVPEWARSEA